MRRRFERRGHFGGVGTNLGKKIAHTPNKDARVPEVPVSHHLDRTFAARLLRELGHRKPARRQGLARTNIAEAGIGTRGNDSHRHEGVLPLGYFRRLQKRCAKPFAVADGPVGVDGHHRRVIAVATGNLQRRPRKRRRGAGGLGLGNEILP